LKAHLLLILSLVLGSLAPGDVAAQQPRKATRQVDQYEITSRMSDAMRVMSSDPAQALAILERLNKQFPDNERVLTQLGYVQQVLGNTDAAEAAYTKALGINPGSFEAGKALGLMYFAKGRDDDGMRSFTQLIEANAYSMSAYKVIGGALRNLGRFREALSLFEDGRRRGTRHFILTLEIAALHRQIGQYREAIVEYLHYVDGQPRNYRFTRDKMLETLREAGDERARIVDGLEAGLDATGGNRFVVLDVLSAHYLSEGLLEKSLEKALAADNEPASDGAVLLSLADQILSVESVNPLVDKKRYLEMGVRALDAFARNHPRQPGTDRAKYMLATIYVEFGSGEVSGQSVAQRRAHLQRAVDEYADLSRRYPNSEYSEIAALERGDVLLHRLGRPRDALEAFKNGAVNARRISATFASRIADVYLGLGEFDAAKAYFDGMVDSGSPVLIQTGFYYTGLMLALQGKYDAARDTLTFLAEEDPSSVYTNDAIETSWVIQEGIQYESKSLETWFGAKRAEMAGDTAAVIAGLRKIAKLPVYETLRPRAIYWLGRTLSDSGKQDDALAAYRKLLKEYPDEELRPDVQRGIANVYENGFGQLERALQEYETVLVEYPEYAFLDEVRKDVRRLRYIVRGEGDE